MIISHKYVCDCEPEIMVHCVCPCVCVWSRWHVLDPVAVYTALSAWFTDGGCSASRQFSKRNSAQQTNRDRLIHAIIERANTKEHTNTGNYAHVHAQT